MMPCYSDALLLACLEQRHDLLLHRYARNFHIMFQDQHVDLAAYTEFRQINPRFHRTAGMWEQDALVLCLKVIQVGPVAMFVGGDAMAGPMDKVIGITCA